MEDLKKSGAARISNGKKNRTNSVDDPWIYGWTHYGVTGQTAARMNKFTRVVEVKDRQKWIRCMEGSDIFFTSL
jgi:hypothetical protein